MIKSWKYWILIGVELYLKINLVLILNKTILADIKNFAFVEQGAHKFLLSLILKSNT